MAIPELRCGQCGPLSSSAWARLSGPGSLVEALQRQGVGVPDGQPVDDREGGEARDDAPALLEHPDQEEADVELEINYSGDSLEVGFNVTYMLDVLNTSSQEIVQGIIKDANSSLLLSFPEESQAKYVIMPMRL